MTVGIDMIINTVAALDHINRRSSAHQMEALRTGTVSGGNPSPFRGPSLADLEQRLAEIDDHLWEIRRINAEYQDQLTQVDDHLWEIRRIDAEYQDQLMQVVVIGLKNLPGGVYSRVSPTLTSIRLDLADMRYDLTRCTLGR